MDYPFVLIWLACLHPGWRMKLAVLLTSIPLVMVVSTIMGFMTALTLYDVSKEGEDHSFKQIHTVVVSVSTEQMAERQPPSELSSGRKDHLSPD